MEDDFSTIHNLSEEKVKVMSVDALDAANMVLDGIKPKADMASGGSGGAVLSGSPLELARQAYANPAKK